MRRRADDNRNYVRAPVLRRWLWEDIIFCYQLTVHAILQWKYKRVDRETNGAKGTNAEALAIKAIEVGGKKFIDRFESALGLGHPA